MYASSFYSCESFTLARISLFGYQLLLLRERPGLGGRDAQCAERFDEFLSLRGTSLLHHFLVHVIQVLLLWAKD
jgi:hypothetical protein